MMFQHMFKYSRRHSSCFQDVHRGKAKVQSDVSGTGHIAFSVRWFHGLVSVAFMLSHIVRIVLSGVFF